MHVPDEKKKQSHAPLYLKVIMNWSDVTEVEELSELVQFHTPR